MALFIAGLAFGEAALLDAAKLGVLTASAVAGVAGWLLLRRQAPPPSDLSTIHQGDVSDALDVAHADGEADERVTGERA
jgi:Na+:H+ antiporter, NhaA family